MEKLQRINLTEELKNVEAIAKWFENQETVDLELGLVKIHEASKLIQSLKSRLAEIENEFVDIKKNLGQEKQ